LITPQYLKKGDTLGIVAPARRISREELQPAVEMIASWGLNVRFSKNLFGACDQFSGTDAERAADLQDMLSDPSVKAIISARGGYGTLRIIDKLRFEIFQEFPKWIIGYSDITVLHSQIHQLGIETMHGTMPVNFMRDAESAESLRKALFGEQLKYSWQTHPLNRRGKAQGMLVGGNLSLLYAMNGSASDLDTDNKILFLEDLDEYLYHIDRMMLNLKRSGKLKSLSGLIVGGMTAMKDNAIPFGKSAEEIILDAVKEYDYPITFGLPAGHTDKNLALILGRKVSLKVSGDSALEF
jgi:muramoyltetrapeptide carboxypeptidase